MTHPLVPRLVDGQLLPIIYRAVEATHPEEGCGFVFESPAGELRVVPTPNRATQLHRMDPEAYPRDGRTYFEPDMKPLLRASREGQTLRLIFHSHPETGAYFSETDRTSALITDEHGQPAERHPGVLHLVVSVLGPTPTAVVSRLFQFDPGSASFAQIATFDPAGQLAP